MSRPFSYVDGTPVLREVSFKLAAGTVLGLVGSTGGGKSTITRLLTRMIELVSCTRKRLSRSTGETTLGVRHSRVDGACGVAGRAPLREQSAPQALSSASAARGPAGEHEISKKVPKKCDWGLTHFARPLVAPGAPSRPLLLAHLALRGRTLLPGP